MLRKIKLKSQKAEKELFEEKLEKMFKEADNELEEIELILRAVILDNNDMRTTLLDAIAQLNQLRANLFRNCCLINNKEYFDIAFCVYRNFLIKYNTYMNEVDVICSERFEDTKDVSLEIIEIKKKLRVITNDNIAEHSDIHKANEPLMQQIEQLTKKREEILKQPSKKNERLFA